MSQEKEQLPQSFNGLGLSPDLIKVLSKINFIKPTPIQAKAIPVALEGRDVIGIAQTGTGKTLSFFLPMLQAISGTRNIGLIVVPTRELALQVQEEVEKVGGRLGFRTALLIGGVPMHRQMKALQRKPHVLITTPGRLIDHIERKSVQLRKVGVLVLDEADRMLDMGFAPQINRILESVPDERQTLLFSATMPDAIKRIAKGYMDDPVSIEIARAGTSAKNIDQGVYFVHNTNKFNLLLDVLREYNKQPVLVFCRTKHGTRKMARILNKEGFKADEIHSNRTLGQRRRALDNFKKGKAHVLVATDVASRGIDVKEIALVVNYDLPDSNDDYVHRIGRTGRAGHKGRAISFVLPDQYRDLKAIERLIKMEIPVLEAPGAMTEDEVQRLAPMRPKSNNRNRGRRSGGYRGGRRRSSGGSRVGRRPNGRQNRNRESRSRSRK